jgi:hypothetical protein
MRSPVIVDVVRTASGKGKPGGALAGVHPVPLLADTVSALLDRTGIDPESVDDVIAGCVSQAGEQTLNVAATPSSRRACPGRCRARPSPASAGPASTTTPAALGLSGRSVPGKQHAGGCVDRRDVKSAVRGVAIMVTRSARSSSARRSRGLKAESGYHGGQEVGEGHLRLRRECLRALD